MFNGYDFENVSFAANLQLVYFQGLISLMKHPTLLSKVAIKAGDKYWYEYAAEKDDDEGLKVKIKKMTMKVKRKMTMTMTATMKILIKMNETGNGYAY